MRRHALATIGLALVLLATQGCAGFDKFFENLLIAAGRIPPPGQAIPCRDQFLTMQPGTCQNIFNQCRDDSVFVPGDSFAFDDPPPWLSVRAKSSREDFVREICIAPDAPIVFETFSYTYVGARPQHGAITIITGRVPLRVSATATPPTIPRGGSSQLLAVVESGTPTFTYVWRPFVSLSDSPSFLEPNPVATPATTTTYDVEVTDSTGQVVTASVTVTVIQPTPTGADLAVSVTDSPDPVPFNGLLTYTITLTNNGPAAATNVTLAVTPPQQAESGPLTPSQGTCARAGATINCAIGTMASGATVTATIQMFPFIAGTISLSATATATESDPNTANNTATQTTTVLAGPN